MAEDEAVRGISKRVASSAKTERVSQQQLEQQSSRLTAQQREAAAAEKRAQEAQKQYGRGPKIDTRKVKDVKLRSKLTKLEYRYKQAAVRSKEAEILLEHDAGLIEAEGELERTTAVRQNDIKAAVGVETAKKGFDLKLEELGPYKARYSRNGRDLVLTGRKGHLATMQWRDGKLGCELQLREHIRDATWLHNTNSFAVAQAKKVYIYAHDGVELHQIDNQRDPLFLEFLPYHFLLTSLSNSGWIKYLDTSTGQTVAEVPTKKGTPTAFAQNPYNAILHSGHQNGTVQLWSPNSGEPLVKILAHHGPVRSIAMDRTGHYMVSAGSDMRMSVWDIRTFKPLHTRYLRQPGASLAVSDRNLTAVGCGTTTTVWRGLFDSAPSDQVRVGEPYLKWGADGRKIESLAWCPFEDILGIGHDRGFSSALIPGAGEPNFDAMELNPYETVKQRQEAEVKALLHKLQPGMISLDPNFIGNLDARSHEQRTKAKNLDAEKDPDKGLEELIKEKDRARGRNTTLKKMLRKERAKNVVDGKRERLEELLKKQDVREQERLKRQEESYGPALKRFARKGG